MIDVPDGTTICVAGSATYQPNLGFSAEELNPLDWVGDITVSLTGWSLPSGAHLAIYTTNIADTSLADGVFSTFDAGAAAFGNQFDITPGDHRHFQWGFTSLGSYSLAFNWAGEHVTDGVISTSKTFTLQAVPEPSTGILLGLGAISAWLLRRRSKERHGRA